MSKLIDAGGKRCEVVSYEASSDELLEASGWWEFDPSPEGPTGTRGPGNDTISNV